jgi:mannose-6-phosphate isomerase-like protein (cupin superfamily)
MADAPLKYPKQPLVGDNGPGLHWITHPDPKGWTAPVLVEWELRGETWTDEHAHDEYAYVLEGRLFVESAGVTVEATTGDTVCVPGGSIGRYYAPDYARILGIYGPNPTGGGTRLLHFGKLTG